MKITFSFVLNVILVENYSRLLMLYVSINVREETMILKRIIDADQLFLYLIKKMMKENV